MFYAPNRPVIKVSGIVSFIGHVGWAFRDGGGDTWVFGATENTGGKWQIDPGAPANTQSWKKTGTWTQVLQAFRSDVNYNRGRNYYQSYRCISIRTSDPPAAKAQANLGQRNGYNFTFENCLTKSVEIVRASRVTKLPPACLGTPVCVTPVLPSHYFQSSLTSAGFERARS